MGKVVSVDTGFLIAYCDERDPYHMHAIERREGIVRRADLYTLLIPCGVLYEALSTRTESVLKEARKRPISMTDTHLRYILSKQKMDIFITNNTKDFLDILRKSKIRHIELIDISKSKTIPCS